MTNYRPLLLLLLPNSERVAIKDLDKISYMILSAMCMNAHKYFENKLNFVCMYK
jgi:hypothetical protein